MGFTEQVEVGVEERVRSNCSRLCITGELPFTLPVLSFNSAAYLF
jgi:hypothetical protein